MYMLNLVYPGIFEINAPIGKQEEYSLSFKSHKFKVPDRLYGIMPSLINYYWKGFRRHHMSDGLILTGKAGAGKTLCANVLANMAVGMGMRVVVVSNVKYTPELMKFLESLENVMLIFDEFAKVFPIGQQQKILTLLSNMLGVVRIVIITENYRLKISPHILDRPGRLRYGKHFDKLDSAALIEYTTAHNVTGVFLEDIQKLYRSSTDFQIDHLIAIVQEHIDEPSLSLEELLSYLNLDKFNIKKIFVLKSIETEDENIIIDYEKTTFTPQNINVRMVEDFYSISMQVWGYDKSKVTEEDLASEDSSKIVKQLFTELLDKTFMKSLIDDDIIFAKSGITYNFKIVDEEEAPIIKKTLQYNNVDNEKGNNLFSRNSNIFS